jgi:uncharacterized protein YndB with AHSA1/START domain
MHDTHGTATQPAAREFVIARDFDAPRDLVFKAWTELDQLAQWWGPTGLTLHSCALELRPGGEFRFAMRAPDGFEMRAKWIFRAISPPERLVFSLFFTDEAGNAVRAPFAGAWPLEMRSTVTFEERAGKTTLTVRTEPLAATPAERATFEAEFGSMQQGWGGTLDQLAAYLASA